MPLSIDMSQQGYPVGQENPFIGQTGKVSPGAGKCRTPQILKSDRHMWFVFPSLFRIKTQFVLEFVPDPLVKIHHSRIGNDLNVNDPRAKTPEVFQMNIKGLFRTCQPPEHLLYLRYAGNRPAKRRIKRNVRRGTQGPGGPEMLLSIPLESGHLGADLRPGQQGDKK